MKRHERGVITTEHTIWCHCQQNHTPPSFKDPYLGGNTGCRGHWQFSDRSPAKVAREAGWALTRAFGWLCPQCARNWRAWRS